MILDSHQTYIYLCGKLGMTSPRDAFITSLCKACLPSRYAMSLITQRGPTKTQAVASTGASLATPSSISPAVSRVSGVLSFSLSLSFLFLWQFSLPKLCDIHVPLPYTCMHVPVHVHVHVHVHVLPIICLYYVHVCDY